MDEKPTVTVLQEVTPETAAATNGAPRKRRKLVFIALAAVLLIAVVATIALAGEQSAAIDGDTLFSQELLRAATGDLWGYIDNTGKYVINPQFDDAYDFSDNGLACVESGGKYGYIDKTGAYIINPQFDESGFFADNGLALVRSGDKYGYIDKTGTYAINPQFDDAGSFSEGVAVVRLSDKYGLIDEKGKYLVNPIYADAAYYAYCGMLWFADENGRVGYLSTDGKETIPAQFDYIWSYFSTYFSYAYAGDFLADGYAVVRLGDKFGVIDKTGAYIVNPRFDGLWWYTA